jgi:membrane-bound serine protease (ClpP class)
MEFASWLLPWLLIGLGLVLMVAELFVPAHGLLFLAGTAAMLVGVGWPFYHGDTSTGVVALMLVVLVVPAALAVLVHYWPRTWMGRRLTLDRGPEDDATVAAMPVIAELEQLRGQLGRAVSPLRPSGMAEFAGRRIDVLTEGIMVDEGTWVRCIDVKAGKVFVRPVDEPKLTDLENADL